MAAAYAGEGKEEEREEPTLPITANGDTVGGGTGNGSGVVDKAEAGPTAGKAVPVDDAGLDRVRAPVMLAFVCDGVLQAL